MTSPRFNKNSTRTVTNSDQAANSRPRSSSSLPAPKGAALPAATPSLPGTADTGRIRFGAGYRLKSGK